MEIRELILNNFGRFSNQSFQLKSGINIVYGENGFGKSTIHSFIRGMLFGIGVGKTKQEKQANIGRYEPWQKQGEYAGTMRFICAGKEYTLHRAFDKQEKKIELVCETTGEKLNVAKGALDTLIGKVDGVNYENTVSIAQRKVETTEELAAELKNYAANYHSRGSNEIQIERVQAYLFDKKQEIKNQIDEQKLYLMNKKEKLNLEHDYVKRELERLQALLKENQKLESLQCSKRDKKVSTLNIPVLPCLCVLVLTVPMFYIVHRPWNVLTVIIMLLALGLYVWNKLKHKPIGRNVKKELSKEIEKLSWENKRLISELQEKEIILSHIEEQLKSVSISYESRDPKLDKIEGIEIAMNRVEEVSHGIQKDFGLLLNEQASEILKSITKGAYDKIEASEALEVSLYSKGKKLTLEQVSRGTVEQVYFAIRMAITNLLHTEEFPVLLDDTFAYYDEEKLLEALKWLHKNKRQVVIFTCHRREEGLLEREGIPYYRV